MALLNVFLILSVFGGIKTVYSGANCTSRPILPAHSEEYFPGSLTPPVKSPPYPDGHRMYFACSLEQGYLDVLTPWWNNVLTCKNGDWSRDYEKPGVTSYCKLQQCGANERSCKDGKCIKAEKWCDCVPDCNELEDERGCGAIKVDVSGSKSGSIRKLFFKNGYPNNIDCTVNITTDPGKRIQFDLSSVDLGGKHGPFCRDFVSLSHVQYDKQVLCYDANCPICSKVDFGIKSKDNWAAVRFVSKGESPGNTGIVIDWKLARKGKKTSSGDVFIVLGVLFVLSVIAISLVVACVVLRRRRRSISHSRFM